MRIGMVAGAVRPVESHLCSVLGCGFIHERGFGPEIFFSAIVAKTNLNGSR